MAQKLPSLNDSLLASVGLASIATSVPDTKVSMDAVLSPDSVDLTTCAYSGRFGDTGVVRTGSTGRSGTTTTGTSTGISNGSGRGRGSTSNDDGGARDDSQSENSREHDSGTSDVERSTNSRVEDDEWRDDRDNVDFVDPPSPSSGDDGSGTDLGSGSASNASLDELVQNLNGSIADAYNFLVNGSGQDLGELGKQISSVLKSWFDIARSQFGLNETNSASFAKDVYNTLYNLVSMQLQSDYNLRNWYMQNDYNSPTNQIRRLMEAGINPAYYYGCLGNSNALEIGGVSANAASAPSFTDNTTNKQRAIQTALGVASGVGSVVGNLCQGGFGGITNGIKNLADASASQSNMQLAQEAQPFQIGVMQSQMASNFANANLSHLQGVSEMEKPNLMKAQAYQALQQGKSVMPTLKLKAKELDNMLWMCEYNNQVSLYNNQMNNEYNWMIAKHNNETSIKTAKISASASKYAADRSYEATKYASDQSLQGTKYSANKAYQGTKYSADKSFEGTSLSARYKLAADLIPRAYTSVQTERLYDVETGAEVTLEFGGEAEIHKMFASGKLSAREGQTFTMNGRKVKMQRCSAEVLDVMHLNRMNAWMNNWMETMNVHGKDGSLDFPAEMNRLGTMNDVMDYCADYLVKGASNAITNGMMYPNGKSYPTDNEGNPVLQLYRFNK